MTTILHQPEPLHDDSIRMLINEYQQESRNAQDHGDALLARLWASAAAEQSRKLGSES